MRRLVERRIDGGSTVPAFALDLLERMTDDTPAAAARHAHVDPLTERERTVLRHLASSEYRSRSGRCCRSGRPPNG